MVIVVLVALVCFGMAVALAVRVARYVLEQVRGMRPAGANTPQAARGRVTARIRLKNLFFLFVFAAVPATLSYSHLIDYATTALDLHGGLQYLVPLALDEAAMYLMMLAFADVDAQRSAAANRLLVWCFALASAWFNWLQAPTGAAHQGANYFFAGMSLAAGILFERGLVQVRRASDLGTGHDRRPLPRVGFLRWLMAPQETARMMRIAIVEPGISTEEEALAAVRLRGAVTEARRQAGREARARAAALEPAKWWRRRVVVVSAEPMISLPTGATAPAVAVAAVLAPHVRAEVARKQNPDADASAPLALESLLEAAAEIDTRVEQIEERAAEAEEARRAAEQAKRGTEAEAAEIVRQAEEEADREWEAARLARQEAEDEAERVREAARLVRQEADEEAERVKECAAQQLAEAERVRQEADAVVVAKGEEAEDAHRVRQEAEVARQDAERARERLVAEVAELEERAAGVRRSAAATDDERRAVAAEVDRLRDQLTQADDEVARRQRAVEDVEGAARAAVAAREAAEEEARQAQQALDRLRAQADELRQQIEDQVAEQERQAAEITRTRAEAQRVAAEARQAAEGSEAAREEARAADEERRAALVALRQAHDELLDVLTSPEPGQSPQWRSEAKAAGWELFYRTVRTKSTEPTTAELAAAGGVDRSTARHWIGEFRRELARLVAAALPAQVAAQNRAADKASRASRTPGDAVLFDAGADGAQNRTGSRELAAA
ncbi:DUF2637 domain-containing protein [Streptomyces sp. NPDC051162]|uniref:DUF2637 domain-containing protein n=1 Tax=Streptomyces sp. NPDC051162 TaxID=3154747 RepID=UPI00341F09FF